LFADVLTEQGDDKLQVLQMQRSKKQIKTKASLNTKPGKNARIQTNLKVRGKNEQNYRL
jgi:hypothetical protein